MRSASLPLFSVDLFLDLTIHFSHSGPMDQITDIHIKTCKASDGHLSLDLDASLIFPGAVNAGEEHVQLLQSLLPLCAATDRPDFMIKHQGQFYRGRRDAQAVDGLWFRLRKMRQTPPTLQALPSPIHESICSALLAADLCRGGLIYVTGGPGCGKTTTASAILVSRLQVFGGVAFTVEDPPELPLNGRHGRGYCTQTMVAGDRASDWTESLRGILRSQPVGTHLMLFVGEVRDAETAQAMLRAASNGFLVICTSFGTDLISAIDSFYQLLGQEYAQTLASTLRCILHQRLFEKRLVVEMLTSDGASSRVATIVRSGKITQLKDEIMYQRNAMMAGAKPIQSNTSQSPVGLSFPGLR